MLFPLRVNRWIAAAVLLVAPCVAAGCGTRPRPAAASDQATLQVYAADCDANHGAACYELGEAYARGDGAAPDAGRALPLLRRACALDYAGACVRVSQITETEDPGEPTSP